LSTSATLHNTPPLEGISPSAATKAFSSAGGLHLGTERGVDVDQLDGGEHRRLDRDERARRNKSGCPAQLRERCSAHDTRGQLDHGNARDLAEKGHRSRRARVHLQHVWDTTVDGELDVAETAHVECPGDPNGRIDDESAHVVVETARRIRRHRVAAVHAGSFHVLHQARDHHRFTITDRVDVHLGAEQIAIDEHGAAPPSHVCGQCCHRGLEIALQRTPAVHDLHRTAAENVRRPDEHGEADVLGDGQRLIEVGRRCAMRLRDRE
jgi:hypothetical protein